MADTRVNDTILLPQRTGRTWGSAYGGSALDSESLITSGWSGPALTECVEALASAPAAQPRRSPHMRRS